MWNWTEFKKRFVHSYNIDAPKWVPPSWGGDQNQSSLDSLRLYAESYVESAIGWYYAKKTWKARASQWSRGLVLVATGLGGLIPIISSTVIFSNGKNVAEAQKVQLQILQVNQWGYLFFALGAALFAFDRYFGYSTGWMRYISTAMALETALLNFRLDWTKATAQLAGSALSVDSLEILIQTIHDFCIAARTLVEKETQAWVVEFQSNLSQLERKSKAALENARTTAETLRQEVKDKAALFRPGAIELTVENIAETDEGYEVLIDGVVRQSAVANRTCAIMSVATGLRQLEVSGDIGGNRAHAVKIVTVAADAVQQVSVTLTRGKAADAA